MTLQIKAVSAAPLSIDELNEQNRELQSLLEKRKKILSLASCLLCPIGSSFCCCFCSPYLPEKKGDFICTALNPCLCSYDENRHKNLFLLPPEVQKMDEIAQQIIGTQPKISHPSSTNLSLQSKEPSCRDRHVNTLPTDSPNARPKSAELSFSHVDRRVSNPSLLEMLDLSPSASSQKKEVFHSAISPDQIIRKIDKTDPCYSSDDDSDARKTRCITIHPRSENLNKPTPCTIEPQTTILSFLKSRQC